MRRSETFSEVEYNWRSPCLTLAAGRVMSFVMGSCAGESVADAAFRRNRVQAQPTALLSLPGDYMPYILPFTATGAWSAVPVTSEDQMMHGRPWCGQNVTGWHL